jgi:hypothetical protein
MMPRSRDEQAVLAKQKADYAAFCEPWSDECTRAPIQAFWPDERCTKRHPCARHLDAVLAEAEALTRAKLDNTAP